MKLSRRDDTESTVVPVVMNWLPCDDDWLKLNYDAIIRELCHILAVNVEELERSARSRQESRSSYRKLGDGDMLAVAVSVEARETCSHSIVSVQSDNNNILLTNAGYSVTAWIGPRNAEQGGRSIDWPIDCVC
jgi:hypothetical protein